MESMKEPDESQRTDKALRAEIKFYDALLAAGLAGWVYYDVRVGKQVDMFAWITGWWRCAIEVKGGRHMVKEGIWYRREADGEMTRSKNSPPDQAIAGAMAIRDAMKARLKGHEFWINVILALPDMAVEDAEIAEFAGDRKVKVIWGTDNIEEQLLRIIADQPDRDPPDELDTLAESAALDRRAPPPEWQSRKASGRSTDDFTPSTKPSQFSGNPVSSAGKDAPVSAMYSFVINNRGTVNINVPDPGMLTAQTNGPAVEPERGDAGPAVQPRPFADGVVGGNGDFDAPDTVEMDAFEPAVVDDDFDDADPFS